MSARITALTNLQPKNTFYWSDGTGRDTYITNDNGGSVAKRPLTAKADSVRIRPQSGNRTSRNFIEPKVVHYHSDGTGRDYYIGLNDGGLTTHTSNIRRAKEGFLGSLRSYPKLDPVRPFEKRDFFLESQYAKPETERVKTAHLKERQDLLSSRLAQPKKQVTPLIKMLRDRSVPKLPGKSSRFY
eukprot:TRINITY_DN4764_c0_g1_i3.p1 TRINITY_DN4764_c0_g1~~TRINITY_DN4764_c0_g1_i3.p1  ORF type:complete len:185 (-),score=26.27 TRINITY_DN4764_c0_g1_i3:80-634(-)